MPYAAVLFDLFDTLVRFDRERLPCITVRGRAVHTSAGQLHAILAREAPGISLEACYDALIESWQEAERRRAIDHREVGAPERFEHFFRCLALDPVACAGGLAERLIEAHRAELAKAAEFPPHHGPVLETLARRYPLAVVSNFDYTPTALGILESAGIRDLFAAIVVSDQFGWRKPRREIFDEALRLVGVGAAQALFVGDRAEIDVAGARGAGIDAAWLNPGREPLPEAVEPPRFEIRDLGELLDILNP